MKYLSICSGIEAATVAFHPLGWQPLAFAEIEPFPCAVLAHHYPTVSNLGDITGYREWPEEMLAECDLLVGGPPCQAFSVAGQRGSLADERGNLTLAYVNVIDHIDAIRRKHGRDPVIALYENVPGLYSTRDNAFGCLVGALCGQDAAAETETGKWPTTGAFWGEKRRVGYRTLDAQYFGLAQRRRRCFLLAVPNELVERLGDRADPAEILSVAEGLRGDTPPRRAAGEGVAGTLASRTSAGGGLGTDFDLDGGGRVAAAPTARYQKGADSDGTDTLVAHSLRADGYDASDDGTGRGTPLVPIYSVCLGSDPIWSRNLAMPSTTRNGDPGVIAFSCKDRAADAGDPAPTLRAMTHSASHANGGGQLAVAFQCRGSNVGLGRDVTGTIGRNCDRASGGAPCVAAQAGMKQQNYIMQQALDPSEALWQQGIGQGGRDASTQETHAGSLLRRVRDAVGEEAFAEWGLGILDSLQPAEILRSALHGCELRPAAFTRRWVVHCALSRTEARAAGAVQSLREAGREGRPPQGPRPSEQLAGELGSYLSELSRPGAQAERFVRDLWQAAEGVGVLRQALSAVQETRGSVSRERQPARPFEGGIGREPGETVCGAGVRGEAPREGVLRSARPAGAAGDVGDDGPLRERGGEVGMGRSPLAVRRLTVEECEFLMGMPRGYTAVPHRGKPAADGNRYRALGNSMAVPVMSWIGRRIEEAMATLEA